jgi:acyl carrier protein
VEDEKTVRTGDSLDKNGEKDKIFVKVRAIIHEITGVPIADITPRSQLRENIDNETLNIDSLAMIEIIMDIEKSFDISVPEEEYDNITDVESLLSYIKAKHEDR